MKEKDKKAIEDYVIELRKRFRNDLRNFILIVIICIVFLLVLNKYVEKGSVLEFNYLFIILLPAIFGLKVLRSFQRYTQGI